MGSERFKKGVYKDRSGEQIGDFTLICFDGFIGNNNRAQWKAICSCGRGAIVTPNNIGGKNHRGATHCGCKTREILLAHHKKLRDTKFIGKQINGWDIDRAMTTPPHPNKRWKKYQ